MTWQIVGHDWAVALLSSSLAAGRATHAYLFCGPPQIGKTTLALGLAQALNCTQQDPPCGQCHSCRKIAQRVHPDVQLIVGQGAGGSIKIDQIRALRREAVLAPYEGRYRVAILRHMDRASTEAANSLLKLLEEPPAHVVLGLTAQQAELLPATVVSRCQRLDLRPAAFHTVESALLEKGLAPEAAQLIARLSGGRVGWALTASREVGILRQRQQDLDKLLELMTASRVDRLDFAYQAGRNSDTSRRQIDLWASWWRDLLLLCSRGGTDSGDVGGIANVDRLEELRLIAAKVALPQVLRGLKALQTTALQLEANVNTRLALEGLLLQLPRWQLQKENVPIN